MVIGGVDDSTGSALCLVPPWVVSFDIVFTTCKLFMPDANLSLVGILLERTRSLVLLLVCRAAEWGGGGIVVEAGYGGDG